MKVYKFGQVMEILKCFFNLLKKCVRKRESVGWIGCGLLIRLDFWPDSKNCNLQKNKLVKEIGYAN